MGACACRKIKEPFKIDDLAGMDKYYSLMSKQKVTVFTWLTASEGPWDVPESFRLFKSIDAQRSPVRVSHDDEMRSTQSRTGIVRASEPIRSANESNVNWASGW